MASVAGDEGRDVGLGVGVAARVGVGELVARGSPTKTRPLGEGRKEEHRGHEDGESGHPGDERSLAVAALHPLPHARPSLIG